MAPGFSSSPEQNISIGSHIKVPANPIDAEWLTTTYFYDKYSRVIQTQNINHLGQTDITSKLHDFPGKVLATKTLYNCDETGTCDLKVTKRFEYDHAQRLKYVYRQINDQAEIILKDIVNINPGVGGILLLFNTQWKKLLYLTLNFY